MTEIERELVKLVQSMAVAADALIQVNEGLLRFKAHEVFTSTWHKAQDISTHVYAALGSITTATDSAIQLLKSQQPGVGGG